MKVLLALVLCLAVVVVVDGAFGTYFVNWAKYRPAPYTFTPTSLAGIIQKVDEVYYGFYYFCPPPGTNPMPYWALPPYGSCSDASAFQLLSVEPSDTQYIPQIVSYKSLNPNLKVILSIGGWNFPSNYFSQMVASATNRATFIQSVVSFLNQYNLDGVDLDWEFPCSPPRTNAVEISCSEFRQVSDAGGACPNDGLNLVLLAKELKTALGSKVLTIASQAAKTHEDQMNIKGVTPYIDKWHVMTYDYAVSDLSDSSAAVMSPNCPLYMPPAPAVQMCVNKTITDYLMAGVPSSKIMLGIPLYGHTWYAPGLANPMKFGNSGSIQGTCCGPFQQTYGAQPGKGSSLCGTMMYSEILAAQPTSTTFDQATQSTIGYWASQGADGYTAAGTWVSYVDPQSASALANYANQYNLYGAFVFDSSMDGIQGGTPTFPLMNLLANSLKK